MIGNMQISIKLVSKTGARIRVEIKVTHTMSSDEITIYAFPLTITSNLLHDWTIQDDGLEDGLRQLITEMYDGGIGIRLTAPRYGYWFDQHNSEATIHETVNKMRNEGRKWFLQNPAEEDRISDILGGAILTELEDTDEHLSQKINQHLLHKPDRAFARSQAVRDLSTPPSNDQDFINKVAILGIIIDNFEIRRVNEDEETKSLDALMNWLSDRIGQDEALKLVETFRRIKALRNQYPLHDRYDRVSNGKAVERSGVKTATQFFGFRDHDDPTTQWKKVCDRFRLAIQELEGAVLN